MLRTHDNWEKLVAATLRKEEIWQLFHAPSISSRASDFSCPSPFPDFPLDFSPSNSCYQRILIPGNESWVKYIANSSEVELVVNVDEILVNNKPLDSRELSLLKGCPNPPRKLKPGSYWYDKRAGFWGKLRHKPSQIISANLDIGGHLDRCASNGNTLVYINGREIKKVELLLLKLFAGVRCYRHTNFWMYEDGSYSVQGLPCIRANIWGMAGMRLLCSVLSLSFPYKSPHAFGYPFLFPIVDVMKLALIGRSGSGKSTIFKQAKFLYKDIPFMEDEQNNIKLSIRRNIYGYIHILLEAHQKFEEIRMNGLRMYQISDERRLTGCTDPDDEKDIFTICPRLKAFSIWLLNILASGTLDLSSPSLIQHYAPLLEELWRDPAIQKTLERTIESRMLPSVASYFLTHAVDIFRPNYIPSRMDILYAEDCPSSQPYLDFSFNLPRDYFSNEEYRLIRSPEKGFEDNLEGLEMFEDAGIVIFCVPLSDYDQFVVNEEGSGYSNMMTSHKKFFESVVTHPTFDHTGALLLLTKYDLFEEKIKQSPLNQCDFLADFNPVIPSNPLILKNRLAEMAFYYISVQFKRLYASATGRKLYARKVNNLDEESVDGVMNYAREILKWYDDITDYSSTEETSR